MKVSSKYPVSLGIPPGFAKLKETAAMSDTKKITGQPDFHTVMRAAGRARFSSSSGGGTRNRLGPRANSPTQSTASCDYRKEL